MSDELPDLWGKLIIPITDQLSERYPEVKQLVHYTSFSTLKSILDGKELWFSSADTMNDFAEVRHGKQLIYNEMRRNGTVLNGLANQLWTDHGELMRDVDSVFSRQLPRDPLDTFISCWSNCDIAQSEHDNLTMWRGYAADGNGVAIVIDPKEVGLGTLRYSDIVFWPVFYESDVDFISRCEKAIATFIAVIEELHEYRAMISPEAFAEAFNEIVYYLAVTHKHVGFKQEKEWRFVWRRGRSTEKLGTYLKPQLNRGALYEFYCLPLQDDPELTDGSLDMKKIVTEVMIGPTGDIPHKFNAVYNMLRRNSFGDETKVTISGIPYRSKPA